MIFIHRGDHLILMDRKDINQVESAGNPLDALISFSERELPCWLSDRLCQGSGI